MDEFYFTVVVSIINIVSCWGSYIRYGCAASRKKNFLARHCPLKCGGSSAMVCVIQSIASSLYLNPLSDIHSKAVKVVDRKQPNGMRAPWYLITTVLQAAQFMKWVEVCFCCVLHLLVLSQSSLLCCFLAEGDWGWSHGAQPNSFTSSVA